MIWIMRLRLGNAHENVNGKGEGGVSRWETNSYKQPTCIYKKWDYKRHQWKIEDTADEIQIMNKEVDCP